MRNSLPHMETIAILKRYVSRRRNMRYTVTVLAVAILLSGCSGKMNGMIRNDGTRVSIEYEQGMDHDKLRVTMPDGEIFTGKVVMVGASSGFVTGFGSASAYSSSGTYASGAGSTFGVVHTYTGSMQGVLFGDKGHTLRCRFQYADQSGFTTAGGVGICKTSDGRVIDIQW